MQGIRVAVGVLGMLDMFIFSYAIFQLFMGWSAAVEMYGELGNGIVMFITVFVWRAIAGAVQLGVPFSESLIDAAKYCHLWLCFSVTFLYIQVPITFFVFYFFGVNTYTFIFIVESIYRLIAVYLVIKFLNQFECEIFTTKSD